jgi:integrase
MERRGTDKRRVSRGGLEPAKYLADAEVRLLLRYVKAQADLARARGSRRAVLDEAVLLTMIYAGLRPAEVCGLDAYDLPGHHGKDAILVRNGKGGITRTVDVGPQLRKVLGRWLKLYRRRAKPTDPVCVDERGSIRQRSTLRRPSIFVSFLAYCLHVTLGQWLRTLAAGLTPRSVLEKFAAVQMVDAHIPTTDGRTLILAHLPKEDLPHP